MSSRCHVHVPMCSVMTCSLADDVSTCPSGLSLSRSCKRCHLANSGVGGVAVELRMTAASAAALDALETLWGWYVAGGQESSSIVRALAYAC